MQIDNDDLRIENLPDPDDPNGVFDFAMSFDGNRYVESFENCAQHAKTRKRSTLTDLRNALFFAARSSRHRGDDEFLECYRSLLPMLRRKLEEQTDL